MNRIHQRRLRSAALFPVVAVVVGVPVGWVMGALDGVSLAAAGLRGALVGLIVGVVLGACEELVLPRWSRRARFGPLVTARVAFYAAVVFTALLAVNGVSSALERGLGLSGGVAHYLSRTGWLRDLAVSLVIAACFVVLLQIRTLHDGREIVRLLLGRYHVPEEEDRVILFVDLENSTALADGLGDVRYSNLLREVFYDLSEAILAWRGEVNQYLGDGVIVTWPLATGLRGEACIRCYFDMAERLAARADAYRARFGVVPGLRAGVHAGSVVVAWVGEAKRGLAYHGVTMNATARIESKCRDLDARLLISDEVRRALDLSDFEVEPRGAVELRGKAEAMPLFAISRGAG